MQEKEILGINSYLFSNFYFFQSLSTLLTKGILPNHSKAPPIHTFYPLIHNVFLLLSNLFIF
jgi:hypothetical protein